MEGLQPMVSQCNVYWLAQASTACQAALYIGISKSVLDYRIFWGPTESRVHLFSGKPVLDNAKVGLNTL